MSKYLVHSSYTQEDLKGLLKEGGTDRKEAARRAIESLGGTLEAVYFTFGDDDFYLIADMPDHASHLACALAGRASGAINVKTVVLLTPEEVDEAVKMAVAYRAPGK